LVSAIFPGISPAHFVTIANLILLAIGFLFLGKNFGIKTVYCTVLLSIALEVLQLWKPDTSSLTGNMLLDLFFTVIVAAVGQATVFHFGGSTGGTDIIGMILKKYVKMDIGKAMLAVDAIVVGSSFFVFKDRPEIGFYSVFGALLTMLIIDKSIESFNLSKYFIIVTDKPDEIEKFILEKLDRGATRWNAQGSFSRADKTMILVVMNRFESRKLRDKIKTIDPSAFILVSDTSDIIGEGFKSIK
jgi:uncharacterized membrane-anchored protein YitT (DUF2179 family)